MTTTLAPAPGRTWSTREAAELAGATYSTVVRWAYALGHGRPGSGHRHRLDRADVLTCRAWALWEGVFLGRDGAYPERRRLVAEALRARPGRYVVVLGDRAVTVDTPAEAAGLVWDEGRPYVRQIIDVGVLP